MNIFNRTEKSPIIILIFRLAAALILLALSRLMLYFANPVLFPGITGGDFFNIIYQGLRFDISALLYINVLYILLAISPVPRTKGKIFLKVTDWVYVVSNSIALTPNFIDAAYYPFSLKRLTGDIFRYVALGDDTAHMMPRFIHDYWYIAVLWIFFIFLLVVIVRFTRPAVSPSGSTAKSLVAGILLRILIIALCILGMRGGFQLKPITPMTASYLVGPRHSQLALNSSFTLMQTLGKHGLQERKYFSNDAEMLSYFNSEKNVPAPDSMASLSREKLNVMIIILESISKEHIGYLNTDVDHGHYKGFTPFLDSLFRHALVLRGYANGKRSIEGIPGVLSSLPTLMDEDFITSVYAGDKISSLASLLKGEGYRSAFFHGASNGSMGFDAYARSAGIDQYFGRREYGNDADYDGSWGIWDQQFLQFMAKTLNGFSQPFFSSVFTLSSHHPYEVPQKLKGRFREGPLKIQKSISYTDYSLKCFFDTIQKAPWFKNTLFVFCADHSSEARLPYYTTRAGGYEIPIVFYRPDGSLSRKTDEVAEQSDIMPSILDYLGYKEPYIAFGNSVFDPGAPRIAVSYLNGTYQMIKGDYSLIFDGSHSLALYDLRKDRMQNNNCIADHAAIAGEMERILKSVIQQYNNRLIENRINLKK